MKGIVKKDLHYVILCFVLKKKRKYECIVRTPALAVWIWSGGGGGGVTKIQTKNSFSSQIDFRFKDNQEKRLTSP